MGSIIGHRRDYNGVGALRGQQHIPENIDPSAPQPPPPTLHSGKGYVHYRPQCVQYLLWFLNTSHASSTSC